MSRRRSKACVRCGVQIWAEAAVCRDCREADPSYMRMTRARPTRVRAKINTATKPLLTEGTP